MKKRMLVIFTITAMTVTGLVGCGGNSTSSASSSSKTVYGQVTEVNGNEITVTILNKTDESNMEKPSVAEGETFTEGEAPSMPEGEEPSMPEGESFKKGERPTLAEGETFSEEEMESMMAMKGQNGMGGGLRGYETTDETLTVDVENATISKLSGEDTNSAQISDISENAVVEITYTNSSASKVVIQQSMGKGMNKQDMKQNDGDNNTEETSGSSL